MLTKMNFAFEGREGTGLQAVNDMLRMVKFASLELDDFDGYLQTARSFNSDGTEKDVTYCYGFDSLTFSCEMDTDGNGKYYQLAAEVVPDTETGEQVFSRWRELYPERRMRSQTVVGFADTGKNASVVLYWLAE